MDILGDQNSIISCLGHVSTAFFVICIIFKFYSLFEARAAATMGMGPNDLGLLVYYSICISFFFMFSILYLLKIYITYKFYPHVQGRLIVWTICTCVFFSSCFFLVTN